MTLSKIQYLLHELNREYKSKGPNVDSKRVFLRDILHNDKLTIILAKDHGSSNGLDEYVIADNEELDISDENEE